MSSPRISALATPRSSSSSKAGSPSARVSASRTSAATTATYNNNINLQSSSSSTGRDVSHLNEQNFESTLDIPTKHHVTQNAGIIVLSRVRPMNSRELAMPVYEHTGPTSVSQIISGSAPQTGITAIHMGDTPEPIVDVEADGRTVAVLDPAKNYTVKVAFQFDYCFSPFVAIEFDTDAQDAIAAGLGPSAMLGSSHQLQKLLGENTSISRNANKNLLGGGDDDEETTTSEEAEREQARIFHCMGLPVVQNALQGFNSCIFAYGQTSSGKTYTMMGTKNAPGIIPRVCRALFQKLEADLIQRQAQHFEAVANPDSPDSSSPTSTNLNSRSPSLSSATPSSSHPHPHHHNTPAGEKMVKVEVTYMEIYNERVRDLLRPRQKTGAKSKKRWDIGTTEEEFISLRVRQHPLLGPFVDGLTKLEVSTWTDCVRLIRQGNELRMSCTTDMNDSSSRSHAVFQIIVTQTEALGAKVRGKDIVNHRTSKINLVDLAGSERAGKSGLTGKHATEANYINTSLSTLRKVIDVLGAKRKGGHATDKIVVPYRESMITWILSDNFGGNSKTSMIANVSPHWSCFHDTESTLRYATLAKGIVNRCKVNEDPSAKLIRDLQTQLKLLQEELKRSASQPPMSPSSMSASGGLMTREIEDQMEENRRAMEELLAKETGMMEIIQESRAREERLRMEKEGLERDQQRWKREAERLAREKMELVARLERHGETIVKGDEFWESEYGRAVSPSTAAVALQGLKQQQQQQGGGGSSFSNSRPSSSSTTDTNTSITDTNTTPTTATSNASSPTQSTSAFTGAISSAAAAGGTKTTTTTTGEEDDKKEKHHHHRHHHHHHGSSKERSSSKRKHRKSIDEDSTTASKRIKAKTTKESDNDEPPMLISAAATSTTNAVSTFFASRKARRFSRSSSLRMRLGA